MKTDFDNLQRFDGHDGPLDSDSCGRYVKLSDVLVLARAMNEEFDQGERKNAEARTLITTLRGLMTEHVAKIEDLEKQAYSDKQVLDQKQKYIEMLEQRRDASLPPTEAAPVDSQHGAGDAVGQQAGDVKLIDDLIRAWSPVNRNDWDIQQERIRARAALEAAIAQRPASAAPEQKPIPASFRYAQEQVAKQMDAVKHTSAVPEEKPLCYVRQSDIDTPIGSAIWAYRNQGEAWNVPVFVQPTSAADSEDAALLEALKVGLDCAEACHSEAPRSQVMVASSRINVIRAAVNLLTARIAKGGA